MDTERCVRCGKTAPPAESARYIDWEAAEDGGTICPGCLTAEEVQEMDGDMMELAAKLENCVRCGTPVPDVDGEEMERLGWDASENAGARWICPDCHTQLDSMELLDIAPKLNENGEHGHYDRG